MTNEQLKKIIDMHDRYVCYCAEWTSCDIIDDSYCEYFAAMKSRLSALSDLYYSFNGDKKRLLSRERDTFAVTLSIETLLDLICGRMPDGDDTTNDEDRDVHDTDEEY